MKFILDGGKMVLANAGGYIGEKAKEGSFMDTLNHFSDSIVHTEIEFILKPIGHFFKECGVLLWDGFVINLPDLMGYATLAAGAFIIISSMLGKGSMMKTISWYTTLLILALTILGGV
ncbi:hypothetical protein P4U05_20540 [Bacillus paranthracis]|uniref:hypothetical protein n=1 Tax=Bacillus cereus group TaxID=86661 RepID=UPI000200F1F7|nr:MULTISPECIES: hypothetical protein [Bacillus cereus group]ADY24854.1 hypothetical protein YBT020_28489 [Bacillus thuringiensis serovar finitimus YBT-020]MRC74002.1 hypothetical protein [Bacillus thuringiensis]OTX71537.1 hypothetical protein BK722_12205 [Bacillus thuringiensis serovar finitimus]MEC3360532.1 hypothetical protein [Bacillus paranthracis]MED0786611.1 hypothetical protein [Bacillus paranthracis]